VPSLADEVAESPTATANGASMQGKVSAAASATIASGDTAVSASRFVGAVTLGSAAAAAIPPTSSDVGAEMLGSRLTLIEPVSGLVIALSVELVVELVTKLVVELIVELGEDSVRLGAASVGDVDETDVKPPPLEPVPLIEVPESEVVGPLIPPICWADAAVGNARTAANSMGILIS
jgi:hypothetical protein